MWNLQREERQLEIHRNEGERVEEERKRRVRGPLSARRMKGKWARAAQTNNAMPTKEGQSAKSNEALRIGGSDGKERARVLLLFLFLLRLRHGGQPGRVARAVTETEVGLLVRARRRLQDSVAQQYKFNSPPSPRARALRSSSAILLRCLMWSGLRKDNKDNNGSSSMNAGNMACQCGFEGWTHRKL
eukprot:69860-Pleurochrysis_carterae.AAC.1